MDTFSKHLNTGAIPVNEGGNIIYSNFHVLKLNIGFFKYLIGQKSDVSEITRTTEKK